MKPLDDGYRMLAAGCLRKQARRLGKQAKRIGKDDQIEVIHQARVAARRLTAGIRAFRPALPAKKTRKWLAAVRKALRSLGSARDKDVQIDFVRSAIRRTPDKSLRPGMRRLMVRLQQERLSLAPAVTKAATRLRKSGVLKSVRRFTERLTDTLPSGGATIQTPRVFGVARRQILRRLAGMLSFGDCLADAAQVDRHHQMRIEAKHLRYTMEIFRPAYEGELDAHLATVKKLQEALGDLHDCDVWLEMLPGFLEKETKRAEKWYGKASSDSSGTAARSISRLRAGIEHFQARRQADRERIFAELGELWRQIAADGRFDALTALLDTRLARAEAQAAEAARFAEEARLAAQAAIEAELADQQAQADADAAAEMSDKPDQPDPAPRPPTMADAPRELRDQPTQAGDSDEPETLPRPARHNAADAAARQVTHDIILGHYVPAGQEAPELAENTNQRMV